MDLEITSTGKKFYEVPPLLAGILCEAFPESFKRIEKPAPPVQSQTAVSYSVGSTPGGLRAIVRTKGRSVEYVTGERAQIQAVYPDCPSAVLDSWERVPDSERVGAPRMHTRISPGIEG